MDTDVVETELVAKLKRLDASTAPSSVNFGYETLLGRHAVRQSRARRRLSIARGTAGALVVALVCASVWRFDQPLEVQQAVANPVVNEDSRPSMQPRIVRADSWLAVAALEDHIVSLDEALNVARQGGGAAEVARLEKTRAELFASYNQVRYAQLVSANF